MSDVIILRPISHSWNNEEYMRYVTIPHGPLYLAATLIYAGYSVKIIDEVIEKNAEEEFRKELEKNPICVCISSMTGVQIKNGLRFSKIAKELGFITVWGGAQATVLPEITLTHELIDILVIGEGEVTLVELVDALNKKEQLNNIKGVAYKKNNKIIINEKRGFYNLDELPPLPFHLLDMEKYITSVKKKGITRYFEIHSSRGCPYSCNFCHNSCHNNRWRTKSVDKIIEELKHLIDKYSINGISWADEMFSLSEKRVIEICNRIIDLNINIKMRSGFRVDHLANYKDSTIELMKKAGFIHVSLGIEYGNDRILKYANKGINMKQINLVIDRVKKAKFMVTYNFMTGFPTETIDELKETLRLIHRIFIENKEIIYPISGPSFFTPLPGTKLYQEALKYGFIPPTNLEEWSKYDYNNINIPWQSKEFIEFMIKARNIVNNLNQKFIGENNYLRENDFKELEQIME